MQKIKTNKKQTNKKLPTTVVNCEDKTLFVKIRFDKKSQEYVESFFIVYDDGETRFGKNIKDVTKTDVMSLLKNGAPINKIQAFLKNTSSSKPKLRAGKYLVISEKKSLIIYNFPKKSREIKPQLGLYGNKKRPDIIISSIKDKELIALSDSIRERAKKILGN